MNKFKKMLSVALAGCMAVSALMLNSGAVATDMSDIEVSEESSISPRISFPCDLTGLAAGKEKVGWTKLSLDAGDKITFTGVWKPDESNFNEYMSFQEKCLMKMMVSVCLEQQLCNADDKRILDCKYQI